MRGLTLHQPYAQLVALGAKTVETRSWKTSYRGTLAIHASARTPAAYKKESRREPFKNALGGYGTTRPLPSGVIVATAELVDCVSTDLIGIAEYSPEGQFGDFSSGRWGWVLNNIFMLPTPIAVKGMLGLWRVPNEIEIAIEQQKDKC